MKNIYLIVNDAVEGPKDIDDKLIEKNANGEPYYVDDYGMGACHWAIINDPSEAYDRQMRDNVLWAQDRMSWVKKHAKNEIAELLQIIETKGRSRAPLWLEKLKKY